MSERRTLPHGRLSAVWALVPLLAALALGPLVWAGCGQASRNTHSPLEVGLQRQLDALVASPGGPPGAIVTLRRGSRATVLTAGFADVRSRRAPRATDHMRIASVAKAFSGAVAFALIHRGRLRLDDPVGKLLPGAPRGWALVTLRQLLNHTSGLPDYTRSAGFRKQFATDPAGFVSPREVIKWVAGKPVVFQPGSRYEYSNTDNIVVGLIAEHATGTPYGTLLHDIVFRPLRLGSTSFPTRPALPSPFIHGYVTQPGKAPDDVSTRLNPAGAWSSGAIVSTPNDLNAFIRGYLAGGLVPAELQHAQLRFIPGSDSSPPGPGANAAGLAIFRYQTRCGTVYGHTGNFPGYVQFAAATRDGRRAVTTSLNIPAPTGRLLASLRQVEETAVCALLRD